MKDVCAIVYIGRIPKTYVRVAITAIERKKERKTERKKKEF